MSVDNEFALSEINIISFCKRDNYVDAYFWHILSDLKAKSCFRYWCDVQLSTTSTRCQATYSENGEAMYFNFHNIMLFLKHMLNPSSNFSCEKGETFILFPHLTSTSQTVNSSNILIQIILLYTLNFLSISFYHIGQYLKTRPIFRRSKK